MRELFQYALASLPLESGRAEVIETRAIDAREHLTVRTVAGEIFSVVKPDVSEEWLDKLEAMAREAMQDGGTVNGESG